VEVVSGKVAVIGAGVFGAWTAHYLLQEGYGVILIDAYGPANSRASSGGESRLIRGAYGKDAIYTRMARDSLPEWQALSARAGLPIFIPAGILFFFPEEQPYVRDTIAVHEQLGLTTEVLGQQELARRFPMFDFHGVAVGLLEPGFGALMARRAVLTLVDEFIRAGGAYVRGGAMPPTVATANLEQVQLSSGERIPADFFVFAVGPWLPKLFPDVIGERIIPTRQEIFFFAAPARDPRFLPGAMPCWADFNGGDMYYGLPDIESRGVKFAHDIHGPVIDPDTQDRRPSDGALREIIAYRDRRFPILRGAPLTETRVCQYENSSNGDFLIDFHPQLENVLLVGGGSGHGFKHGPEVGRYAAGRLSRSIEQKPRFSLASKSEKHRREVF
jgi:glycine/D-amino acid oxidase-like deaminating enzyme